MSEPLVASVRQRLLNLSRARQEDFNLTLTHYAIERLLYRLSQSPTGERFLLKGAMIQYSIPLVPLQKLSVCAIK